MPRSMTGFGSASAEDGERLFTVEMRSVNHRYCDLKLHLPSELQGLAARLEPVVRRRLSRGRIDVNVSLNGGVEASAAPRVDLARARGYRDALRALSDALGLEGEVSLAMVASAPGVIRPPEGVQDLDRVAEVLERIVEAAVGDLEKMRHREGAALAENLRGHLSATRTFVSAIRLEVPRASEARRAKLEERLAALLGDRGLDPSRLAQEVAVLADRSDITEETERLESHIEQFDRLLQEDEPVGRKLDFLVQEMNREANTVGAKCSDARIAHLVVELKAELERLREQVQNLE